MINYNGTLTTEATTPLHTNRGFLYGDAVFETLKIVDGKILFLEDHYFRLMASMRILRMEIPMEFTMEYMQEEVIKLVNELSITSSSRARLTFYRQQGGFYLPTNNNVAFIITAEALNSAVYELNDEPYEVDLYKDFYVTKQLLSTLKTTNKAIHITGSIYGKENGMQNCFIVNNEKNVIEALQGNLFIVTEGTLVTPPVSDGCLNGIMRKQIMAIAEKMDDIEVIERSVSPFELQKADELFITNVIKGIQPVTKYRKKEYGNETAAKLLQKINTQIRLGLV